MGKEGAAGAVMLIIVLTVLGKTLGLAREMVIAAFYGAGAITDAYLTATLIVMLIFNTLGGRYLGAAFIPVQAKLAATGDAERTDRFSGTVLFLTLLAFLLAGLLGSLGAPALAGAVAPGLPAATRELTAGFARLLMAGLPLFATSSLLTSLLHLRGSFAVPAAAGVLLNGLVICFIFLSGGDPLTGLVAGTLGGYLAQVLVAAGFLLWKKARLFSWPHLREPGIGQMGLLLLPVLAGGAVTQLNPLVNRVLASGLPVGSISALGYADRIIQLVLDLLATAVITVSYPALAVAAAAERRGEMKELVCSWGGLMLFFTLPTALVLAFLSYPLVQVLLERGAFNSDATRATAAALFFYSFGLPFVALSRFLTRVFYACHDTRTPVLIGMAAAAVNIIGALLLVRPLGHSGLALASSVSAAAGVPVLLFFLNKKTGISLKRLIWLKKVGFMVGSAAVSLISMLAVSYFLNGVADRGDRFIIIYLAAVGLTGFLSYFLAARCFRLEEAFWVTALLKRIYI